MFLGIVHCMFWLVCQMSADADSSVVWLSRPVFICCVCYMCKDLCYSASCLLYQVAVCWAWSLVYLVTTDCCWNCLFFFSSLQLPSTRKRVYIGGAKKWPRPRGHVQDPNVQVCGQLIHWCLPPLQCPDLPKPWRGLPAGKNNSKIQDTSESKKTNLFWWLLYIVKLLNHRLIKLNQDTWHTYTT